MKTEVLTDIYTTWKLILIVCYI